MRGEFLINGKNTYTQWGVVLAQGSIEALFAFPPAKEYVTNASRLENGVRVLTSGTALAKDADREVNLVISLLATGETDFKTKYASFLSELRGRTLDIKTTHSAEVYHCLYKSCTTFSDWNGRVCSMVLRLWEYNPGNRTGSGSGSGSGN